MGRNHVRTGSSIPSPGHQPERAKGDNARDRPVDLVMLHDPGNGHGLEERILLEPLGN